MPVEFQVILHPSLRRGMLRVVESMSQASKISSRFRLTIPKAVRKQMGLRPGQKLAFIARADGYVVVRVPTREEMFGMARGANTQSYRDRNDRY